MPYRIVPDNLRLRKPVRRGRSVRNQKSKDLLAGRTLFEVPLDPKNTWGHYYKLASNHHMKCTTQITELNGETGTLIWFDPIEDIEDRQPIIYRGLGGHD